MKKILLILVVILSAASANAQFKDSGFKIIGEAGLGFNWATMSGGGESISGFGYISPGLQASFGGMLCNQVFLGGGLGYEAAIGTGSDSVTFHGLRLFAHGRFYTTPVGNGLIIDVKLGYKRILNDGGCNTFDFFVGPGYMWGGKYAIALGYGNSLNKTAGLTTMWHGPAAKFSIEF